MVATLTLNGKRYKVIPEDEYDRLVAGQSGEQESGLPPLPEPGPDGNYPAIEYLDASIARDIIRSRRRLGLSQAELARRADIRIETLNRIEKVKSTPSVRTIDKIERALQAAQSSRKPSGKRKSRLRS